MKTPLFDKLTRDVQDWIQEYLRSSDLVEFSQHQQRPDLALVIDRLNDHSWYPAAGPKTELFSIRGWYTTEKWGSLRMVELTYQPEKQAHGGYFQRRVKWVSEADLGELIGGDLAISILMEQF